MENKPKHTPGPWRIGDAGNTVFGPNDGKICPAIIAALGRENHSANAALIAAAPELLEAAKIAAHLLHFLEPRVKGGYSPDGALHELRAAIAKAEGGK